MGGITVGIRVDHLSAPELYSALRSDHPKILLAPNLPHSSTVKSSLKSFVRVNLQIPEDEQLLAAPLFTKLGDGVCVEEIYRRYMCQVEREDCDLFVDEELLSFFGREKGITVNLSDDSRLDEWNIVDHSVVEVRRAPRALPVKGGRLLVETKHGILPVHGISGLTRVSALKEAMEKFTGIPRSQQLLSSVGRVMHDEFYLKDFDGVHAIFEDSIVDLTVSGDKNKDQAHRRMQITISVAGHEDLTLVVQGRDLVQGVASLVEARTGISQWQQRITLSGKALDVKKTLADYMVSPDSILHVTSFKSPMRISVSSSVKSLDSAMSSIDYTPAARKLKMIRTCKGLVTGTLIVPVLTSDTLGDLRRKVKRSLRPLEEKNNNPGSTFATPPTGRTPKARVSADCSPAAAYKLPPPPLEMAATPPFQTPPQTPKSCYHTPVTRSRNARRLFSENGENAGEKPLLARRLFNENSSVDEKLSSSSSSSSSNSNKKGVGAWLKQILQ